MSSIQYVPVGKSGFRCTVVSDAGRNDSHLELVVLDADTDSGPLLDGDDNLLANPALVGHLLNAGVDRFASSRAIDDEVRNALRRAADFHARAATDLADWVARGSYRTRQGWCSSCFRRAVHRDVDGKFAPPIYLCSECGDATTPCAVAGCRNMARRLRGSVRIGSFCAEHRHEVRGFQSLSASYPTLDDVGDMRSFEKRHVAAITKTVLIVGVGAVVVAPVAFLAAPAIGGALGASGLIGPALSGAAASSHGLAFLGGGSIAAGGAGMLGGASVVTATGAALGGTLGGVTAAAYVRDDRSFSIEKLRDGAGAPVLIASGFLTEGQSGWGDWQRLVDEKFGDHPVYRINWGARELKALAVFVAGGGAGIAAVAVVKKFAARAARKIAGHLPGIGAAFLAADALSNPWHVARSRAEQTAAVLADTLSRVQGQEFVLIGHSLGARVMLRTAELLGTKKQAPRIKEVHLLGAAVGRGGDWRRLNDSVRIGVWNYHSRRDKVLGVLYPIAQAGQTAVGNVGFRTVFTKLVDVDVTETIASHSEYVKALSLSR